MSQTDAGISGASNVNTPSSAQFVQGSTMRHVVVMASTGSLGLMTLFVVDLVDMYFLSLLGEAELAAAIGYAGTILFFTTSISIGVAIAAGALVSKSLGAENVDRAKQYGINVAAFGIILSILASVLIWMTIPNLLDLLGATGRSKTLAIQYLRIIIPTMAVLMVAMSANGILRAVGDAKRSMYATVSGGVVNAILDPIFIFSLGMGIKGAAWASVIARIVVMLVALHSVQRVHKMFGTFRFKTFLEDLMAISKIAIPAVLTNIATPIGNAYVIFTMAKFGDSAVAGMSVIGRLTPVAFAMVFALSGAVGPIIGQNFGAKKMQRVVQTVKDAIIFSSIAVISTSAILFLLQNQIISVFNVSGDAADVIHLFCTWIAISFIFNGTLFVANACFNNLGFAHYSTIANFAKATIGTIPFVYLGATMAGAEGLLIGRAIGTVLSGLIVIIVCFMVIRQCNRDDGPSGGGREKPFNPKIPLWPQTNTRG